MTVRPLGAVRNSADRTRASRGGGTGTGRGWIRSADRDGFWGGRSFGTPAAASVNLAVQTRRSGPVIGASR